MKNNLKISQCSSEVALQKAKYLRQKYFFDAAGTLDPYLWTFDHTDHIHFCLYLSDEIIGYAHIQLWPENRAALRIIVLEKEQRSNGFGSNFLKLCEDWLKNKNYKSLHTESNKQALNFYINNLYVNIAFNDPDGYESDPNDIALGKLL